MREVKFEFIMSELSRSILKWFIENRKVLLFTIGPFVWWYVIFWIHGIDISARGADQGGCFAGASISSVVGYILSKIK